MTQSSFLLGCICKSYELTRLFYFKGEIYLSSRRTTIDWNEVDDQVLLKGGDNFDYCQEKFFKSLRLCNLSERTAEFYQENLIVIRRALHELKIGDNPESITYCNLQDVLDYCMTKLGNSPGTINH